MVQFHPYLWELQLFIMMMLIILCSIMLFGYKEIKMYKL
nr:ATP synthase F0 subunit 8 [Intoshia linei]UIB41616.1 ATP synthase F0 subunit 8 [Intoshia linei]